ncbi:nucleotidyltransferase family protein, partial [Chloroflexota bacterium]
MKAVILVGGEATRLRPLTSNTAKAMMPVLNTPFLEHVLRHLGRHQITDIILAQGLLAQPIEGYLGDGSQFEVKLNYVIEDTPKGTAGAVKNTERYLDETFLVAGVVTMVTGLPLVWFFVKPHRPEYYGWLPDGKRVGEEIAADTEAVIKAGVEYATKSTGEVEFTLRQALRGRPLRGIFYYIANLTSNI